MNPITSNLKPLSDEQIAHWLEHNVRKRFHEKGPITAQDMMLLDMQISLCTELLARRKSLARPEEALKLAEQWKGRGDDCGRLARAIIAQ